VIAIPQTDSAKICQYIDTMIKSLVLNCTYKKLNIILIGYSYAKKLSEPITTNTTVSRLNKKQKRGAGF
jgi:hypothetical protein